MKKHIMKRFIDLHRYKWLLFRREYKPMASNEREGCGLSMQIGIQYERWCRSYIKHGLTMLDAAVGENGKFELAKANGHDLDIKIVLLPTEKNELRKLFSTIREIITFYENFIFDDRHGVHARFHADEAMKRTIYDILVHNADELRFINNGYRGGFLDIIEREDGLRLNYDEYLAYQKSVSGDYADISFLQDGFVEFQMLGLSWADIGYVIDIYESAQNAYRGWAEHGDDHQIVCEPGLGVLDPARVGNV